jgi:very-short-patch-repair endonuclease
VVSVKDKARALRKNQTDAELVLWQLLRGKRMKDLKFRRQHPIPPYIVDFICTEKKLIIEADGGQHADAVEYDKKRTIFLESKGYTVIRFWNNEILTNIDGVYQVIQKHLNIETPSTPRGEG